MADPVGEIIGDYKAFAAMQRDRLTARGVDIAPFALSHLAFRVADWERDVHLRTLERHAPASVSASGSASPSPSASPTPAP